MQSTRSTIAILIFSVCVIGIFAEVPLLHSSPSAAPSTHTSHDRILSTGGPASGGIISQPEMADSNVNSIPLLRVAMLVQDASALDFDEENIEDFLRANDVSFDIIDANMISDDASLLNDYNALYMRTSAEPVSFNSPTVVERVGRRIESGAKLVVEYYGGYLAQYLGIGAVGSRTWDPILGDATYFVEPAFSHDLLLNIRAWSPPYLPDDPRQLVAELKRPGVIYNVPTLRFNDSPEEAKYWFLLTTYGCHCQDTDSEYCLQHEGVCTPDRSVFPTDYVGTFSPQSYGIRYVGLGAGRVYSIGLNLAGSAPADALLFGPVAEKIRLNVLLMDVLREVCGGIDEILDYEISAGENLVCSAASSIRLAPGFVAHKEAIFWARITQ